jgi:hypothetical protein
MAAGETPYPPDDSERESDRLWLLLEVSNAMVSKLSLKELLVTVSSFLKRFIDHDFASVVLYNEESQKLHVHASISPALGGVLGEGTILPMDGTPPGLAIRTRQTVRRDLIDLNEFHAPVMAHGFAADFAAVALSHLFATTAYSEL